MEGILTYGPEERPLTLEESVDKLLKPDNLRRFVGTHGVLCFALVREITAPGFYGALIENAATIDTTTREHVAFVVFYGGRTGATHRSAVEYRPFVPAAFDDPSEVDTTPGTAEEPSFDPNVANLLRYAPGQVDRPTLSQDMGRATQLLIQRYAVSEDELPCLLFVDANVPTRRLTVPLSATAPLQSLYTDVLRTLSQEFAELSDFWGRREALARNESRYSVAEEESRHLPQAISRCDEVLAQAVQAAAETRAMATADLQKWRAIQTTIHESYADASVLPRLPPSPEAWRVADKLRSYQRRLAEAQRIIDKLPAASQDDAVQTDARALSERLRSVRQSIQSKSESLAQYVSGHIQRLEQAIGAAEAAVASVRKSKIAHEVALQEANVFLLEYNPRRLEAERRSLETQEASLRFRGYGDDVVAATCPSAFSVIDSLLDRKSLGSIERRRSRGQPGAMRILFLAANPLQTSRLDLEEEIRSIESELRGVKFRDAIALIPRHAVRPDDLIRHVREDRPNVIHFSGHGSESGIVLRTDEGGYTSVGGNSLKRFLQGRNVSLVVLNACHSKAQADSMCHAVASVIGTSDSVEDEAARRFAVAFYRSLGNGLPVGEAFRDGGDAADLHGLADVFYSAGDMNLTLVGEPSG